MKQGDAVVYVGGAPDLLQRIGLYINPLITFKDASKIEVLFPTEGSTQRDVWNKNIKIINFKGER